MNYNENQSTLTMSFKQKQKRGTIENSMERRNNINTGLGKIHLYWDKA